MNEERTTRRIRRGSLAVGLVLGLLVGGAGLAGAADSFSDVPNDHPFHDDIAWLADSGVTGGFNDGTYRPSQNVNRGSMAAFLRRLAGGDPSVDPIVDAATVEGMTAAQLKGQTGAQGPAGPAGPAVPQGPAGTPATSRWAAVNPNGTLARSSGVTSAAVAGTGYEVIFNTNVTTCTYQVTAGALDTSTPLPIIATVAPRQFNTSGVFVQLYDAAGAATTGAFHVAVFC